MELELEVELETGAGSGTNNKDMMHLRDRITKHSTKRNQHARILMGRLVEAEVVGIEELIEEAYKGKTLVGGGWVRVQ